MVIDGQARWVAGFIVRRLLWTIPVLWVVATIVFFMMRSIGGGSLPAGPDARALNRRLGQVRRLPAASDSEEPARAVRPRPPVVPAVRELPAGRGDARLRAFALIPVRAGQRADQAAGP